MTQPRLIIYPAYILVLGDRRVTLSDAHGALLSAILYARGERLTTDELAEALWPDPDEQPDEWLPILRWQMRGLRRRLDSLGARHILVGFRGAVGGYSVVMAA